MPEHLREYQTQARDAVAEASITHTQATLVSVVKIIPSIVILEDLWLDGVV